MKKKKSLTQIICICIGVFLGLCFIIGLVVKLTAKDEADPLTSSTSTSTTSDYKQSESSTGVSSYEMDAQPILIEENTYESLYGTGAISLTDNEYNEICSTYFYGDTTASSVEVQNTIINVRNSIRSGNTVSAYNSLVEFGKTYSLQDGTESRDLAVLARDLAGVKDLPILSQNGQYEDARRLVDGIRDVECYLISTMLTGRAYMFYQHKEAISLDAVLGIIGNGALLPETDAKYTLASTYNASTPLAIYRFTLQYNADISFYAYVVTDEKGQNHILTVENIDGTIISPLELETGTEYQLNGVTHGADYDKQMEVTEEIFTEETTTEVISENSTKE